MDTNLISQHCGTPTKVKKDVPTLLKKNAIGETHIDTFFITSEKTTIYDEVIKYLDTFQWASSVCIDGMSCVGKTTILRKFENRTAKINNYMNIKTYNVSPSTSLAYLILGTKLALESKGILIDRSPISNLIWLYANQLAEKFPEGRLCRELTWTGELDLLMNSIEDSKLPLQYVKGQNVSALFILDSNIKEWNGRLKSRNEGADCSHADSKTFWMQLPVYAYFANLMGWPTIDLEYFRQKYNTSKVMSEVQLALFDFFSSHLDDTATLANIVHHQSPISLNDYLNCCTVAHTMNSK